MTRLSNRRKLRFASRLTIAEPFLVGTGGGVGAMSPGVVVGAEAALSDSSTEAAVADPRGDQHQDKTGHGQTGRKSTKPERHTWKDREQGAGNGQPEHSLAGR